MLFIDSLLAALSPFTLAMNFVGVMLGMIVGALPGLGSVVAITICLPFTFGMTSVSAIALLLGVYCGSICGGSIAAVLINTPGTPQSAATAFDGYPMARAGKPGKAIGWALAASIFGGVFSCVILTFAAPQIAVFALQFGPLETCALILMGFIAVLCILGSYGSRGNLFDVFVTVFMGIAAYFMRRMEFPLPPLVIGLVLGQQFEMSIGQMMLFKGDDSWLAFVSASPIAMVLLGMAFLLLVVPQVQNYRALRAKR